MDSFDVLKLHNISYVNSQIACSMVELEAMKAENLMRERRGEAPAWSEEQFLGLIDKFQLGHNAVLTNLNLGM